MRAEVQVAADGRLERKGLGVRWGGSEGGLEKAGKSYHGFSFS